MEGEGVGKLGTRMSTARQWRGGVNEEVKERDNNINMRMYVVKYKIAGRCKTMEDCFNS